MPSSAMPFQSKECLELTENAHSWQSNPMVFNVVLSVILLLDSRSVAIRYADVDLDQYITHFIGSEAPNRLVFA